MVADFLGAGGDGAAGVVGSGQNALGAGEVAESVIAIDIETIAGLLGLDRVFRIKWAEIEGGDVAQAVVEREAGAV